MQGSEYLKICPFCGRGETRIDENTYWTGMRSVVSSVSLRHWCEKFWDDDFKRLTMHIRARTKEQAIEVWNQRC